MPGKHKRPSSARRNIKQELFSPFVSSTRLRRLQELLCDEHDTTSSPDALLCIAGIDARYNEGMQELVNYILFSFFGVRKLELAKSGYEEEVVEDVMFLIRKHSVDVYCNPINYMYFLPYIAHWRNLRIHCMKDDDYDDEEKAEEFKISSFVRMTEGCRKIAVPFSSTTHQQQFDIMAMEKWPIVQAFALEEVGGGGFFTMRYEVEDLSDSLFRVYQAIDPVSLEGIITEHLPLFERQWDSMLTVTDAESSNSTKDLSGKSIIEPLKTYFQHGRINSGKGARRIQSQREPFALIGADTKRSVLENAGVGGMITDKCATQDGSKPPQHMICQSGSPKSALCCSRTYFFSNGVLPHPVLSPAGEKHHLPEKSDIKVLQRVYSACIDGVLTAITAYSLTLDAQQAEQEAKTTLLKSLEESRLPLSIDHIAPLKHIDFKLEAYDGHNRCVSPVSTPRTLLLLKFCGLTVYDIPSVENRGTSCGSVSFGETFLNSVLNIELSDGSSDIDGEYTILSSVIPRFISWQRSPEEKLVCQELQTLLKKEDDAEEELNTFGRRIMAEDHVQFITEDNMSSLISEGELYIYEYGLVYSHPHHGIVILPKAEMTSLHLYDGNSPSVVAFIVIGYQEHIKDYLPLHMRCSFNRLILVVEPKTKAYKYVFSEVLSVWKDPDQKPELQWLEELPEELTQLHNDLQNSLKLKTAPVSRLTPMKKAKDRVQGLQRLVGHFESSSVSEETVPRKHTELLACRPWDEGSFNDTQEVVVNIIGGVSGSGKLELCECLRKLSKQDSKWTIIKPGVDNVEIFDKEAIVSHLRSTYLAYRTNRGSSFSKMRAIVVTPGFTDIVDVIQAIVSQHDRDMAKHLKIGAVTVCIDPQNAYMCDRYTFPKLLDQCAQGWVNNIVFTTSPDPEDTELEYLQNTIRSVNSDVALMLASRGEVSRAPDLDRILSDTAFNTEDFIRARYQSCPGWWKGTYNTGPSYPKMEELVLRFSQPLERNRLNTRLKDLKTNLKKHPFHGNVYYVKGKVMFAESQQVHDFHYVVLSNSVTVTTSSSEQMMNGEPQRREPFSVVFTGIGLSEAKLKDWLRDSAKQKPQKKIHRTRKNLNRVEINRIHKEHHLEPLPEGWFYNGAKYVSLDGEKSDHHPNLDEFLEDYLRKINKDVDTYNARIDFQEFHDLFE